MKRSSLQPYSFLTLFALAALLVSALPAISFARQVPFSATQDVANNESSPDWVETGDFNNDGSLDVVAAVRNDNTIAWYQNNDPGFTTRNIDTSIESPRTVATGDIDNNGLLDVVAASSAPATGPQYVYWYSDTSGGAGTSWARTEVFSTTDNVSFQSVAVADLDGDGDGDVLAASFNDSTLRWFDNANGDGSVWTAQAIASTVDLGAIAVDVADIDGDGDLDPVLIAETAGTVRWFANNGDATGWTPGDIATGLNGPRALAVADIDRDGSLDVLVATRPDNALRWYANANGDGSSWTPGLITDGAEGITSISVNDLDLDGDLDVLAASRDDDKVAWHENSAGDGSTWIERILSEDPDGVGGAEGEIDIAFAVRAGDIDGDGDPDVVATSRGNDRIAWFPNATIHRSALFTSERATIFGTPDEPTDAVPADLDGDGDLDVLASSRADDSLRWHANDGAGNLGAGQLIFAGADGARAVAAADLDGDGDLDVLAASLNDDTVRWFENDNGDASAWTPAVIDNTVDGAIAVASADFDLDGDLDVVAAGFNGDQVIWYENTNGDGSAWLATPIAGAANDPIALAVGDINRDGAPDLVVAARGESLVRGLINDGSAAFPSAAFETIGTFANNVRDVAIGDVNGDGDLDVLAALETLTKIAWYAPQSAGGWSEQSPIPSSLGIYAITLADFDQDGDLDIGAAEFGDDRLAWYEQTGSGWNQNIIPGTVADAVTIAAADFDRDGDIDLVGGARGGDSLIFYPNVGGQFALATTDLAPSRLLAGDEAALLQVDAAHRGRSGDRDAELVTFELLFTDSSDVPLTTTQLNAALSQLRVYRDTGSGIFEPASDTPVATLTSFTLASGRLTVTFADDDANLALPFASTPRYFVAATAASPIGLDAPDQFRVTHITGDPAPLSSGEDRVDDIPLLLEYAANGASQLVQLANGVVVTPISLITDEFGSTDVFTVSLDAQPAADVTVTLTNGDSSEGALSTAPGNQLVFTTANWDTPQTVTVTGQDDPDIDGDISYDITFAVTSTDLQFDGRALGPVSVLNRDDDSASVDVTPTSLTTEEDGTTAAFTVTLTSRPTADVVIDVDGLDTTEGALSAAQLTFTAANWDTPQSITVTGQDDDLADGDISYTLTLTATSSDLDYNAIAIDDVNVTNRDDDLPGIEVTPTSLTTDEGGATDTFTVTLRSQPTADVVIGLDGLDATEGALSATQLTFTPANWDTPQSITVTGQDDDEADGDISYTLTLTATSSDLDYEGFAIADVAVTNLDNDTAGIDITPASLETAESGTTATFTVTLRSQPGADVVIGIAGLDATEGSLSATELTFTPANWTTPQTVTVTGQDDDEADGDISYTLTPSASSTDTNYDALAIASVSITNLDDDTASIDVTPTSLETGESGTAASFTVVLRSQPTANVVIGITGLDATEGALSATELTFTPANWSTPQTVTVTGQDDEAADGDITYTLALNAASSDLNYNLPDAADVSVTNLDDDTVGVIISESEGTTDVVIGGAGDSYTVVLRSQPTSNVIINLTADDQLIIGESGLIFTSSDWNQPQTVNVSAQTNAQPGTATIVHTVQSTDAAYAALPPATVTVTLISDGPPPNVGNIVYLPFVGSLPAVTQAQPDLVGSIRIDPTGPTFNAGDPVQVTAIVTNQGNAPAGPFWADLFINPFVVPDHANSIWNSTCGMDPCYGIAWGVKRSLAPGESVTLTSTVGSYVAEHSVWPGYFAAGTTDVYLYIDSWNPDADNGTVAEQNETNNQVAIHGLTVTGANSAVIEVPPLPMGQRPAIDRLSD